MLTSNSRYMQAESLIVVTDRGNVRALYRPVPIQNNQLYSLGVVTDVDRIDIVSAESIGNANQWWVVADLNPQFHHPDDLVAGVHIRVPLLPVT